MPQLKNISIRNKLAIMLVFPLLALFYFSFNTVIERYHAQQEYHNIHSLIEVSVLVGNYVHESQKERGMTAGYLATSGQKFAQALSKEHAVFNKEITHFLNGIQKIDLDKHDITFSHQLNKIKQHLEQLPSIRQQVLSQTITTQKALDFYTQLNTYSLNLIGQVIHLTHDGSLVRSEAAYLNFLQSKERAGLERAVLTATFGSDKFTSGMDVLFSKLISAQNTYLSVFNSLATQKQQATLKETLNSPVVAEVNTMRQTALSKRYEGNFGVDPAIWFKTISHKIDLLKEMETTLAQQLITQSEHLKEEATSDLIIYITGMFLVLLISFILVMMITKNLLDQVKKLRISIENVTESGEFKHFANMTGKDEIAQMSRSFDTLLHHLQTTITESNTVINAIAKGDFDQRIQAELKGDLNTLKKGINYSAENINETMTELEKAIQGLASGQFNTTISNNAQGRYHKILNNTSQALKTLHSTVTDVNNVMSAMEQGQFNQRIQAQASGDLETMKQRVNNAMSALASAVKEISTVVVAQSSGDLTQQVNGQYPGDLGILAKAINDSSGQMNATLAKITNVARNVSESASEVSSGSEDLNKRTQQAAATLEETSASMEEITETVKQNTEVSQQANQVATVAKDEAIQGAEIANKAIHSMSDITESSQKILDIIGLIDSIAFQTNLLALNAAVEAARAGEHGRGFAVVASEVRNLAQKSAEASKEIKTLIEETVSNVQLGSEFVEKTGQALETINSSIQNVSTMIGEISHASHEQQQGIEHVNHAISDIDTMTQQNSALVEETTASAEALMQQADALKALTQFFKTQQKGSIKTLN